MANVLARPDDSGGVRGVTYAQAWADDLRRSGATRTTAKYPLLSRQSQYNAIGIYANVAGGMRFLNREDLSLTPALGEASAEAFHDETKFPNALRRAVLEDGEVSLTTLKTWGEQAHVGAEIQIEEAKCLYEALHGNPVRSRAADLLRQYPPKDAEETELERLKRMARALTGKDESHDLREAIQCIQEFEACYQLVMLACERLLWLCRHHATASIKMSELEHDAILQSVRDCLPSRVRKLASILDNSKDAAFRSNLDRLSDVHRFLTEISAASSDINAFVAVVIARPAEIQHGKFDRGRRKMPWVELNEGRITLTITRAGGLNWEATRPGIFKRTPIALTPLAPSILHQ